jgi:ectoine hydroxylase-related dioxygenase (phytanoyl-CoA dioxygenase family)
MGKQPKVYPKDQGVTMEDLPQLREVLFDKGFFIFRSFLSEDEVGTLKERFNYVLENHEFYHKNHGIRVFYEKEYKDRTDVDPIVRVKQINNLHWRDNIIWENFTASHKRVQLVKAALGEDFNVNAGGFFTKRARTGGGIPWHADPMVWGLKYGDWPHDKLIFSFWCALDRATLENGCLQFAMNSHKKPLLDPKGPANRNGPEEFGFDSNDVVAFEMEPGDLLVWHQDLVHGSEPNCSKFNRLSLAGSYINNKDIKDMRLIRPFDHLPLENAPVCVGGKIQEVPHSIPEFAE